MKYTEVAQKLAYDPESGVIRWINSPAGWIEGGAEAGSIHKASGYRHIGLGGKKYRAHRLAWLLHHRQWPTAEIDHINGDRLDNRMANLRLATYAQNQQNRSRDKRNKSGFTGVSWDRGTQKWRAKICIDRRQVHLGVFDTAEEAAAAYAAAKAELHTFQPVARTG